MKLGHEFLVVVAQFVNENWLLRNFVLACTALPGDVPKTREFVTETVNGILADNNLDKDNMYFITDEGSNVVHLGMRNGQRLSCFAHILATISRHVTSPYAGTLLDEDVKQQVRQADAIINDLQQLVGELRLANWLIF